MLHPLPCGDLSRLQFLIYILMFCDLTSQMLYYNGEAMANMTAMQRLILSQQREKVYSLTSWLACDLIQYDRLTWQLLSRTEICCMTFLHTKNHLENGFLNPRTLEIGKYNSHH